MASHEASTNMLHEVPLPGRGSIEDETSGEDDENFYLFSYQTYTRPTEFYRLDLQSFNLEKIYDNHFLTEKTGYNPDDFTSDYVQFESKDGTKVPLSIIRRKDVLPSVEEAPKKPILTHLTAYGGFGTSKKPEFSVQNMAFFQNLRGVLVIAHIRGGGEKGQNWWNNGKKDKR